MGDSETGVLSTSPSNCARLLSRVISVLKREGGEEEESTSTFYLSGFFYFCLNRLGVCSFQLFRQSQLSLELKALSLML